jgi:aminoglycoside phosphotransferase (APT) family kinase protein
MSVGLGLSEGDIVRRLEPWLRHRVDDHGLVVRSVSVPGNGASNLTGVIDLEAKGAQQRLILRTLSPDADQLYETYDLQKQYRIMECLGTTELKVPRLLAYETDEGVLGREFYVMYDTGGRAVPERPSYHQSGWFADLAPSEQRRVWFAGIDTIASIHRLDWQALGLEFVAPTEPGGDHNRRWVQRHSDHLGWMERRNGRQYPRLRAAFSWLEANFPVAARTSFLWADAKLGNVMIEGSEIVGVLDWEHSTIGPALYDLANWMIFDRLMSEGADVPRLASLPSREETVRRYEEAVGGPADELPYFELFSAVRLANVVCGMAPDLIKAGLVAPSFVDDNAGTNVMDAQLAAMGLEL